MEVCGSSLSILWGCLMQLPNVAFPFSELRGVCSRFEMNLKKCYRVLQILINLKYMMIGETLHYYETLNYGGSAGIFDHLEDDYTLWSSGMGGEQWHSFPYKHSTNFQIWAYTLIFQVMPCKEYKFANMHFPSWLLWYELTNPVLTLTRQNVLACHIIIYILTHYFQALLSSLNIYVFFFK